MAYITLFFGIFCLSLGLNPHATYPWFYLNTLSGAISLTEAIYYFRKKDKEKDKEKES